MEKQTNQDIPRTTAEQRGEAAGSRAQSEQQRVELEQEQEARLAQKAEHATLWQHLVRRLRR